MIALGVLAALAAAIVNAVALVLQASEARRAPAARVTRFALLWGLARRPRWLTGTALLVLAWPLQILALSFAPLTVVQPVLASFQLILLLITRVQSRRPLGRVNWLGALAVTAGVTLVIVAAPHRTVAHPSAARLAVPLTAIAAAALTAYVSGRRHPGHAIFLTLGAGLGYAWVDFADKLLSNAISSGQWLAASVWVTAVIALGAIAFLQENVALQRLPVVRVAPVIGAIQEPLPVLMALAAGVEIWTGGAVRVGGLASGLALAGAGAVLLARSARVRPSSERLTGAD